MRTLFDMLSYMRPARSKGERHFINRFIVPLGVEVDDYGNLYKRVGDAPTVLWSAHTDSVHLKSGTQRVVYSNGYAKLAHKEKANCLGADNAAGVWMLCELIKAGVPGLYVFHREEESGGGGSKHFAKHSAHLLEGIKFAVAFDRRKTTSIITHQMCGRTASDAFAKSLADQLGMGHKADDGGTFTDTASYADIIPECSNVSVGFLNEHSSRETLDVGYLFELRDAMINVDLNALVCERKPGDYDQDWYAWWKDDEVWSDDGGGRVLYGKGYNALVTLCRSNPEAVADYLESIGIDAMELEEHVWRATNGYYDPNNWK